MEGAKQVGKAQKNKTTVTLTFFHSSFTFKLKRLLEFKLCILKLYSTYDKQFGGTGEASVKYNEISSFTQWMMKLYKPQNSDVYSEINWNILFNIAGDLVQSLMIM